MKEGGKKIESSYPFVIQLSFNHTPAVRIGIRRENWYVSNGGVPKVSKQQENPDFPRALLIFLTETRKMQFRTIP